MNRNNAFVWSLFALLLALDSSIASAQTAVINWTDRGWYQDTGDGDPIVSKNYIAGDAKVRCPTGLCSHEFHDFFVFDLSSVAKPIASAELALFVPTDGYGSSDPSENYELHDVVTPISTLSSLTGGLSAYSDLGTGVIYGSRAMTEADEGTIVTIALNASAVAALNASHGLFAIGGSITTLDNVPNNEFTFGGSGGLGTHATTQLRLTYVPEPTSAALFAFAAMIVGVRRSRN